jgi:histidinol-phosphatase
MRPARDSSAAMMRASSPGAGNLSTVENDEVDDLALALEVADAADEITRARFGADDLTVHTKDDRTPVSDADRAVEHVVRATLAERRPDDAISGEEFGAEGSGPRRWVIDPIDATKNYVRGVPVWATLIGLVRDGLPVVGVVSAPALGRRWWAAQGRGAWASAVGKAPRRIAVSTVTELTAASLSYSSVSGWTTIGRRDRFLALMDTCARTRAYGDFWSYMLVAEGAVDLAAEPELAIWDMAALAPIVTEAGGRFTALDGADGVSGGNAAASNGLLHGALLAAIGDRSG